MSFPHYLFNYVKQLLIRMIVYISCDYLLLEGAKLLNKILLSIVTFQTVSWNIPTIESDTFDADLSIFMAKAHQKEENVAREHMLTNEMHRV